MRRCLVGRYFRTTKVKLILTVAGIVLFFAIIIAVLTFGQMRDTAERTAAELADTVLEEADTHVSRFFMNMEEIAIALAAHTAVYNVEVDALRELILTNVWSRRDYMRAIYLGTETGEMLEWGYGEGFVDNTPVFPPDYDPRIRPWYKAGIAADAFSITDPYLYASIAEYGITCVLPVYRPGGEKVGVLGLDIMLESLEDLINDFQIGKGGRVYISDRRGAPLVDQFSPAGKEELQTFVLDRDWTETGGRFVASVAGVPHFFSYKENGITGWTIYVGLPVPAVMAATNSAIRMTVALNTMLMILLLITLEWTGSQLLIEPVERMVRTIGRIRSGEGGARIDIRRDDEFGVLARAFNDLADTAEEYTLKMEQKVQERTARLRLLQQENIRLRIIEEKERIYGYLHDSLGARLVNIIISNNVARSAAGFDAELLQDMHRRVEENAQAGLTDLKEILSGSLDLDRTIVDFRRVLEIQVRRLELKKIGFFFEGSTDDLNLLPGPIASELEKTLQELTTNVLKHAAARNVTLSAEMTDRNVLVRFSDDGRGFDVGSVNTNGYGLMGIRNRVERLNGDFSVETAPKSGVTVTIKLPLEADTDETD
ncbi:MAG: cache domain-containing protein [Alkalispirochaeta sp.]